MAIKKEEEVLKMKGFDEMALKLGSLDSVICLTKGTLESIKWTL